MTTKQPSEHAEQAAVASWLRRRQRWFFAVPNGAKMGAAEAAKMKREGLEPGVLDLWVVGPEILGVIEMKARESGVVSPEQQKWLSYLDGLPPLPVETAVCHGAIEAMETLKDWGLG